mgnify:CR=1 FL=1
MEFVKDNVKMETLGESIGQYTIIKRDVNFEPYIVAWLFHYWEEGNEHVWEQGHYFFTYTEALCYAISREFPTEILSTAINICDQVGRANENIGYGVGDQLFEVINYIDEED